MPRACFNRRDSKCKPRSIADSNRESSKTMLRYPQPSRPSLAARTIILYLPLLALLSINARKFQVCFLNFLGPLQRSFGRSFPSNSVLPNVAMISKPSIFWPRRVLAGVFRATRTTRHDVPVVNSHSGKDLLVLCVIDWAANFFNHAGVSQH